MALVKLLRSIVNPSGGLVYHYSAFRHRRFTWRKYHENIEKWLLSWPQRQGALLLIGPSAGYSLSKLFLSQYDHVDAIDPDPLAKHIFKKKYGKSIRSLTWHQKDAFGAIDDQWNPDGLESVLKEFPQHSILFCNVLGQLPLLYPQLTRSVEWNMWQKSFQTALKGRKWASYHDLFSLPMQIKHMDEDVIKKWERDQESDNSYYLEKLVAYTPRKGSLAISDHCTSQLFPAGRRRLFTWQRVPGALHIVEARRN